MHRHESRIIPALLLLMTCAAIAAVQTSRSIKEGRCTATGVHLVFRDGTQKDFSAGKDYKCADFKISTARRYAAWQFAGTLIVESAGQKQSSTDATVYVLVGEPS